MRDPSISREEVKAFLDGLRVNQARRLDLADMKAFGGKPYPFMLVAIDALTKKVAAEWVQLGHGQFDRTRCQGPGRRCRPIETPDPQPACQRPLLLHQIHALLQ